MAQLDSVLVEAQASREAALQAGLKVDAVVVLVQALKDQVAAGGGVSQAEIDSVLAVLAESKAASEASSSKLGAALA